MAQRRGFGTVRELPSGRWQARVTDPRSGRLQSAPDTFTTKAAAGRWLASMETDFGRCETLDLDRAKQSFGSYARTWLQG